MSAKVAKKIRKQIRSAYRRRVSHYQGMSIFKRLAVAWKILFKSQGE